jgi:DNA polymerase-3 subunit alpha
MKFVHLHLHTHYELRDGVIRLEPLFERAAEFRLPALAMTNHGNLFGAMEFYRQAHRYGIKPILGCECYIAPGSRLKKEWGGSDEDSFHLILLARNLEGYRNLSRLVSLAHLEGFHLHPRIDKGILKKYREGLIGLSSCLKGEIPRLLLQGRRDQAARAARELTGIFGSGRFFVEIQRNGLPEQDRVNPMLIELARELSLPLVATNNCHYLDRKDAPVRDTITAIRTGKTVSDMERMSLRSDGFYFRSPGEMEELFRDFPESLENTIRIAEECNLEFNPEEKHYPAFPLPSGATVEGHLEKTARTGLKKRFSRLLARKKVASKNRKIYEARLQEELGVIRETGFANYFLIVADFVSWARKRGVPVGPGRGSVPGSLAAFALGITEVDPVAHGLLFERFLNREQRFPPRIDMDFGEDRRDEVFKYLEEKYGKERVARVNSFGVMHPRAAVRDAGRLLEMPYEEMDRVARLVPAESWDKIQYSLQTEPCLQEMYERDPRARDLIDTAQTIEGLARSAAVDDSGVVVSDRPLTDYMPLCRGRNNEVVTQFTSEEVEDCGMLKFDLAGLKALSILAGAVRMVKKSTRGKINLAEIPLDDARTRELVSAGKTVGIFLLDEPGMAGILVRIRPVEFRDLVSLSALYRPGPLVGGMIDDFIKRKKSKRGSKTRYPIPQVKEILEDTYGMILFQEQIMEILHRIGGFSLAESDRLKREMAKAKWEQVEEARPRFIEEAVERKVSREAAGNLFEDLSELSKYAFNKSHSLAYNLIAYQSAYLKANYPVFFMAALLSASMDDPAKLAEYLDECKAMGIEILFPEGGGGGKDVVVTGEKKIKLG